MLPKGVREDRKKIDEAINNKKISMAVGISFPALPRYITYLENVGIVDNLAEKPVNKQRKCYEHMEVFPLLYLCKTMSGVESARGTKEMLSNKAAMAMIGFTQDEIDNGLTKRGKSNQYGKDFTRQSQVVSEPTIIDNIAAYSHIDIIDVFNNYIRWIVAEKLLEVGNVFILDSTIIETTNEYPGAKRISREEEDENGNITVKSVYGFKVFILMDSKTKVPVAMEIVTAEKSDCNYLTSMLEKGIANLGEGKIKLLLADRGFIDGKQMWDIKNRLGVDFIIPAKKNMEIWKDVTGLRQGQDENIVMWDYGKKGQSGGYLVEGAVSYGQFAKTPVGNKKNANADPLTAVVVTHWRDKPIGIGKEKVLLTTLATKDALVVMKNYKLRSLIENCGFREMKQAAYLSRLPQIKGDQAEFSAYAHMALCVLSFATFIGFLVWDSERAKAAKEKHLENCQNLRGYRTKSKSNNGYVFVYFRDAYAIYELEEVFGMLGVSFGG